MEDILQHGLKVIKFVQEIRTPLLDSLFLLITSLGNTFFYLLLIPFLYYCIDKKMAARLIAIFCLSNWINSELKQLFDQPRPYNLDPSVKVGQTGGPGIPSGHAQGSLVLWGYLAVWKNNKLFYCFAVLLILLIAFSRIYLGVHFPTDIIGGWILGILILSFYFKSYNKAGIILDRLSLWHKLLLSIFIPLILSLIMPTKWSVFPIAVLSGFSFGYYLELTYINFGSAGTIALKSLRYLTGMITLGIIYYGLKLIFPGEGSSSYLTFLYIRYWVTGISLSLGVPWLFKKLKI